MRKERMKKRRSKKKRNTNLDTYTARHKYTDIHAQRSTKEDNKKNEKIQYETLLYIFNINKCFVRICREKEMDKKKYLKRNE